VGYQYPVVNAELPNERPFELFLPEYELAPDASGVTRIPLGELGFLPQRKYRLEWIDY